LTDLETALDRVTSRHSDSVVPWRETDTMVRETMYDRNSEMWWWEWDVAVIREHIDETRTRLYRLQTQVRLHHLREAASESH